MLLKEKRVSLNSKLGARLKFVRIRSGVSGVRWLVRSFNINFTYLDQPDSSMTSGREVGLFVKDDWFSVPGEIGGLITPSCADTTVARENSRNDRSDGSYNAAINILFGQHAGRRTNESAEVVNRTMYFRVVVADTPRDGPGGTGRGGGERMNIKKNKYT